MAKVFVFDYKKCNGCRNCQVACKDEHCEQPWLPYAQAQPMTGQFWCKIDDIERGQVPVVRVAYKLTMCNHCDNAACLAAGGDAVYRRDDGLVVIDPEKAKGHKEIVDACPIGAIYWNEELELPQKCTGCAHLLDNGWDVPRCVDACPTGALSYVEESDVDLSKAETLPELDGAAPRFYYLNVPKRFIAGAVVNLEIDELMIGFDVDLLDESGTIVRSVRTDAFGDFIFDQIEPGIYTVRVGLQRIEADVTERDLSLGDIALQ